MIPHEKLQAMSDDEQKEFWRKRQVVNSAMQVENQRRELAVSEARMDNPDLLNEYEFRRAKPLLDIGFTPEMISAAVDVPVEELHIANQVYGFIDQTAKERGQAVLDRFKEEGFDTEGYQPNFGRGYAGFGHF